MQRAARYLIAERGDSALAFRLDEISEVGRLPAVARTAASRRDGMLRLHGSMVPLVDAACLSRPTPAPEGQPGWFVAMKRDPVSCVAVDAVVGIRTATEQRTRGSGTSVIEHEGRCASVVDASLLVSSLSDRGDAGELPDRAS